MGIAKKRNISLRELELYILEDSYFLPETKLALI